MTKIATIITMAVITALPSISNTLPPTPEWCITPALVIE